MKKLAIVTGGTRGIGRAITETLVNENFDVYFTYQNNQKLAHELEQQYPDVVKGFQVNSHDWQNIEKFAAHVTAERNVSVLINNVGINQDILLMNAELTQLWEILQLNIGSTLAFTKYFLNNMMRQRQGHIINISSVAASKPKLGNSAYGASKAAIERLSKTWALELARFNITVNCISPGFVKTDLFNEFLSRQDQAEFYRSIPLRKVLEPIDVSHLVAQLALGKVKTTGSIFVLGNGENIINTN